jgi:hypothetical protein
MPKKACCCKPKTFCCNSTFYKDFITLYGTSMAEHAEVSPDDWVALYVPRKGSARQKYRRSAVAADTCKCCCGCPPSNNARFNDEIQPCNTDSLAWREWVNSGSTDAFDLGDPRNVYCRKKCCAGDWYLSSMPDANPIVFAYKYSGCNLIWHPREMSFDFDPYVSQCNGFFGYRINPGNDGFHSYTLTQNTCNPQGTRTDFLGSGGPNTFVSECGSFDNTKKMLPAMPCACMPFPHIHGGVYDSVYNRINVKLNSYQLGYVSSMAPFADPMTLSEAGCCWCSGTGFNTQQLGDYLKSKTTSYRTVYPKFDQSGKLPFELGGAYPGINCHYSPYADNCPPPLRDCSGFNPNYKSSCFSRGISPYLLRISKTNHKMAYDIWGHGRFAGYAHDFGPVYQASFVNIIEQTKDIEIKFKKVQRRSLLREQYIGIVQLEHRFECYAYRSDDASKTIDMLPVQNHCNMLMPPFERGYSGTFTPKGSNKSIWNPHKYDSLLWQTKRGVPRRVMYRGSGIPLFHFDLVNMENISITKNIQGTDGNVFDGVTFLEHYYRYYFALRYFTSGDCKEYYKPPGPPEWDFDHLLNSYNYVSRWIELMIENGVLRIKDHAIDISEDVNNVIAAGTYITNDQGKKEILIADGVAQATGGLSGYIDLINFFGVSAGTPNATTPKIIKQKLLNEQGLEGFTGPSGDLEEMRCFLPRKATLPTASQRGGITAWGCCGPSSAGHTYDVLNCAAYTKDAIDVPSLFNITDPDNVFININPVKVVSGLGGTFIIDVTGKIAIFGGIPSGGDNGIGDNFIQYPPTITSIPYYFNLGQLFDPTTNPATFKTPDKIIDGKVIDIAFKGDKFAAALCDFEHGGIGILCGSNNSTNGIADDLPAGEFDDDYSANYVSTVSNGDNITVVLNNVFCAANQPFESIPGPLGTRIYGPRGELEKRNPNAFRIKSWGSEASLATFSLSQQDSIDKEYPGHDEFINPLNLRYPGTNCWYIWTKIASGLNHFVAIDDMGGLFATPQSDNTYKQCEKGFPITADVSYLLGYNSFGRTNDGFGGTKNGFFYYYHIPRPGYIKENEWTPQFYDSLCNPYFGTATYRYEFCSCEVGDIPGRSCKADREVGGGGGGNPSACSSQTILVSTGGTCGTIDPPVYDKTCYLLGTLIPYSSVPIGDFRDSQPRYIDVVAGHFNTLLLTNENKIEIYGTYWQIDENGEINGPNVSVADGSGGTTTELRGITAFVPDEVLQLKGDWNVTYACTLFCDGVTHSPIIDAVYNPPGQSNLVTAMDSASDYSMCVANNNRIYVWGDASMVPGKYNPETYVPGTTASTQFVMPGVDMNQVTIDSIAAGVNAFYIYYRLKIPRTDLSSSRLYSYTRFGKTNFGTQVPTNIQNKQIISISAGYDHAVAIYSTGIEAKTWDYDSFAEGTKIYQYKNWNSIPAYFKRDAFFHAIPGSWDYSKWLYGDLCCGKIDTTTNPVQKSDPCAALAYNIYKSDENGNPVFNENLSFSGHPEYFWMRPDWRRLTPQAFDSSYVPNTANQNGVGLCDYGDQGQIIDGFPSNNQSPSALFSTCFSSRLDVWAEGRPAGAQASINVQTPIFPPCWRTPDCFGGQEIYVDHVIPDDVQALAKGHDVIPGVNYKSTRDIFQKRTDRYGDDAFNNSPDAAVDCAKHETMSISYFKYSERHYYFGYDRDLDTWDIYENPDFLHQNTINGFTTGITCDHDSGNTLGNCPIIYRNPQNGWGGGTGPNGGTAGGLCGYLSLFNYPMTGPSYPEEIYQLLPINYLVQVDLYNEYAAAACYIVSDNFPCYPCGNGFNRNRYIALGYFGGPAAFAWSPNCLGYDNSAGSDGAMWNGYDYWPYGWIYLSGKELLKGTDNNIGLTLPPNLDPEYTAFSFTDVLKDTQYTETTEPWLKPASTKWIPLCWESRSIFTNCGVSQSTDVFCFSGVDNIALENNEVVGECGAYRTINIQCDIAKSCCLPPSA